MKIEHIKNFISEMLNMVQFVKMRNMRMYFTETTLPPMSQFPYLFTLCCQQSSNNHYLIIISILFINFSIIIWQSLTCFKTVYSIIGI